MDIIWQDLRYAWRTLRRNPGFVVVAVLSLGLGIGANTAIFSIINTVVLRTLPVEDPARLVLLTDPGSIGVSVDTTENGVRSRLSYPEFDRLRAVNTVLANLTAVQSAASELTLRTGGAQQLKARGQLVSGDFFALLGIRPIVGRAITATDDVSGAAPVAVISDTFWQSAFAGDPGVVGKSVLAGQTAFSIIGVAPKGFEGISVGSRTDIWLPMALQQLVLPNRNYLSARDTLWLQVLGRLKDGLTRESAQAGINVEFQRILADWARVAKTERQRKGMMDQSIELREGAKGPSALRDQFSNPLFFLFGMVGMVLLIACANIANLMLARATGRQREIGLRLAIGAPRRRLMRQLLTESMLLAAAGGITGVLFAVWGTDLLISVVSSGLASFDLAVDLDRRVFLFTAGLSMFAGLLFGIGPAFRATRVDVNQTLASGSRGNSSSAGSIWSNRMLAVAQVSLSMMLLVGATLVVRSLRNLVVQQLGFARDHILMVRADLVSRGYQGQSAQAFEQRALDQFKKIPGVQSASLSKHGFFGGDSGDQISFDVPTPRARKELGSAWESVGPDYFSTIGVPILRGREISQDDFARASSVAVVNDAFAKFFFPDGNPIGAHVTNEYPTTRLTYEIIGVVADVRDHRLRGKPEPRFYANIARPIGVLEGASFVIRTTREPSAVIPAVRQALATIDRELAFSTIRAVGEQIDRRLVTERLIAQLSGFFAGLALLMAAIGLYGVMSYSVTRRTREIGVRMALGAAQSKVLRMVMGETMWLVAIGVAIGLPSALVAAKLLSSRLFGLSTNDSMSIAIATSVIVSASLLAGYIPARRAARVDPMNALRAD